MRHTATSFHRFNVVSPNQRYFTASTSFHWFNVVSSLQRRFTASTSYHCFNVISLFPGKHPVIYMT